MPSKMGAILVTMVLAATPAFGQSWAAKMFRTTEHDFGSVARSAKTEYEFVLSNIYLEDVHIAGVRSSCGCTSVRVENPTLKTYERGAIVATFNTHLFLGSRGATLTVTIDRPTYAEVQLHVKGYIRGDTSIEPGSVQFGETEQGTPLERRVQVNHLGWEDWRLVEARSANPHLKAQIVSGQRANGSTTYEVAVRLDNTAPPGYLNENLILVTNDQGATQVPLLVEGRVLPGVRVSPTSLFLGVVPPGQKVTKQLVVAGKKPFRITSVGCNDKAFEVGAAATKSAAKTLHLVPVTFTAGAKSGPVSQSIRIETDLGGQKTEATVYAVVAAQGS
jgi:hypothetical protein